jgi:hypothetical protein
VYSCAFFSPKLESAFNHVAPDESAPMHDDQAIFFERQMGLVGITHPATPNSITAPFAFRLDVISGSLVRAQIGEFMIRPAQLD